MSELLVRITSTGLIKQQYLGEEIGNDSQSQSIHSFLSKQDYNTITDVLKDGPKEHLFENIIIDDHPHFLYVHKIGSQYLLYFNLKMDLDCQASIVNLIKVFAKQYMKPAQADEEETKFLFESIQKLNNDLINKQRETAKLNHELNRLNSILNNRLVKDPLTKLVSRYQYRDEILMEIEKNPDSYGLFWFIDIDNFKAVNDAYGHRVGDLFLIEVGNRLKSLPFKHTVKIRIAGDEFGLFMSNVQDISNNRIKELYDTFKNIVCQEISIEDHALPFSCSVGISIFNKDSKELHTLIDYADFAMYQAKLDKKDTYKLFNADDYKNK